MKNLEIPKFVLCENPIKTGDLIKDNRLFIYAPSYLSFIEIIPIDTFLAAYNKELVQKTFFHNDEEFLLVLIQNNIQLFNSEYEIDILENKKTKITEEQLINDAWSFFLEYLIWEDNN